MTRFGYYLLLSNSSIKLNSFKKYYYNMLSYFSKDFESMYKKFISSHLVSYNNKNNTIKLIDINFEHFLHVNYRNFIIKERNKKIEGLIPKEPITDIISLINLVINHLNITSKPIITQTGYISKSIVNKILNDIPNYISGELNENQYLVIIEFLIQLLFQSDFIKISMERTLIITNTYFEFITMSKNNKMKHLSDNYQYFIQHGEIYVDDFFEYEIIADQSIISFLKTIEDLIYKSGKIKNKYILQSEIIFSYYKTILNSENDDEFNGFEINDIKSGDL